MLIAGGAVFRKLLKGIWLEICQVLVNLRKQKIVKLKKIENDLQLF